MKTRRQFLMASLTGGAALAALPARTVLAQMGSGGMGMTGGMQAAAVIDPPPGAPFKDPTVMRNLSRQPGLVEVNLEAKLSQVSIGGKLANLLTYNGVYPAPTINVRRGDHLRVHFTNSLPQLGRNILGHDRSVTNLHTHGLHVSPSGHSDNAMVSVKPGDTFVYEYDLAKQEAGSLNFYHPHVHGTVAEQYWAGLVGALQVADNSDVLAGYETHVLLLKDITVQGGKPAAHAMMDYMRGKEGEVVMVNGQVNPVLAIKPGQVQRWNIINASNARFYKLSLEHHQLYVVGTESGLLDRPYPVSSVLLSPGERVQVLVQGDQAAKMYRLLSLPYNRASCCGGMGQQVTMLTLAYGGARIADALPTAVNPGATRLAVTPAKTERLTLSMGMGMGMGNSMDMGMGMSQMKAAINGVAFDMSGSKVTATTIKSKLGTYEVWQIFNQSMMDHPFHQHVNAVQVLSIQGGDPEYAALYTLSPARKDVVIVPKMGSVELLVPVMDYAGTAMFHCHILEHEDIGMMGIWQLGDAGMTSGGGSSMPGM